MPDPTRHRIRELALTVAIAGIIAALALAVLSPMLGIVLLLWGQG
jgi:hypothetical protein